MLNKCEMPGNSVQPKPTPGEAKDAMTRAK